MKESFHFLGVGGIGMSALARILIDQGKKVSGSDLSDIASLEKIGIKKQDALPKNATVIYSSAIQESHPHLTEAKQANLPLLHRAQLLSLLLENKKGLLVAGTHGKTSTSALLAWTLMVGGKDPSFAVGGILQNLQKNGGEGKGTFFVAEADESDGSFLHYAGEGAIVTNIENEHMAYWKTEENLLNGYAAFIKNIKNPKHLFWCADDPTLRSLNPPGISYGKTGELKLLSCAPKENGTTFSFSFQGKTYSDFFLLLFGEKQTLNALAVFGMAFSLGIDGDTIRKAFASFQGIKRRQEKIGTEAGITLYDDYAHHPTEIEAALSGLKPQVKKGRLIALFQPHRYSRTQEQFHSFQTAFEKADLTIITSIYPAGEKPLPGISGKALAKQITRGHPIYIEKSRLLDYLPKMLLPGDLLVTMGAGDITTFGPQILRALT